MHARFRTVSGRLLSATVAVACLVWLLPSSVLALPVAPGPHTLVHVGPSGLETYDAATRRSTTLVAGMKGTWVAPVLSPNGISAVTLKNNRTDRAYSSEIYGAIVGQPSTLAELSIERPGGGIGMTEFRGWVDDYHAVWVQDDPANQDSLDQVTLMTDVRNPGAWQYYSGPVNYPTGLRASTKADKAYVTYVNKSGVIKITRRRDHKTIAKFKLPGFGGGTAAKPWLGWLYWAGDGVTISPDGKYIAYELDSEPTNSSLMLWRTYVCTIKGKSARRIKNDNGGFVWR